MTNAEAFKLIFNIVHDVIEISTDFRPIFCHSSVINFIDFFMQWQKERIAIRIQMSQRDFIVAWIIFPCHWLHLDLFSTKTTISKALKQKCQQKNGCKRYPNFRLPSKLFSIWLPGIAIIEYVYNELNVNVTSFLSANRNS